MFPRGLSEKSTPESLASVNMRTQKRFTDVIMIMANFFSIFLYAPSSSSGTSVTHILGCLMLSHSSLRYVFVWFFVCLCGVSFFLVFYSWDLFSIVCIVFSYC